MLYQHQTEGAAWLAARPKAYLGDKPGTGKTRTLIAAAVQAGVQRPLIVCPAIVQTHWRRELLHMARVELDPVIASYDAVTRGGNELMRDLLLEQDVDALILDEAHYCKHATSQRAQQLLGPNGYARRLATVWPASGTPVPKNAGEFWTVLSSLFPEVALEHGLRTHADFAARFCVMRGAWTRGKYVEKPLSGVINNEAEFKAILAKVMLVRTLDDVGIDVPTVDWQVLRLNGGAMPGFFTGEGCGDVELALQMGEDLALIATDPHVARMRRRLGELKVAPVAQMLASELADSDEKVVVFAHHTRVLESLRELLKSFGVAYIDGDVRDTARAREIDRFQDDPRTRVFLGQNIACQTGITLTAARRVVMVEPDWTAVVNQQLGHRVARIGQTARRCVVQMVALADTLDEAIVGQNAREVRMLAGLDA